MYLTIQLGSIENNFFKKDVPLFENMIVEYLSNPLHFCNKSTILGLSIFGR